MADEDEYGGLNTDRRVALAGIGGVLTAGAGAFAWAANGLYEKGKWEEETLHPGLNSFLEDLEDTDYEKIGTNPGAVDIRDYTVGWDGNAIELSFETPYLLGDIAGDVDNKREFYEEPSVAEEDAISQLMTGQYLEEGAELFGLVADNLGDLPKLEEITVKYTTDVQNINSLGIEYSVSTGEIGDNPEEQYRETILPRLE